MTIGTALRDVVRATWERTLDEEREVDVPTVADRIIEEHSAMIQVESVGLIRSAIIREIKDIARSETEQSSQLTLFGFPSVIAVPVPDDGFHYIRATKAHWDELVAGAQVRTDNVRRAQEKLDIYMAALAKVRPVMEGNDATLAQAIASLEPVPA